MNERRRLFGAFVALALSAAAEPAFAQFESIGARSLAMGGASAAVTQEPWNGFDNPAALAGTERLWLGAELKLSQFRTLGSQLPFGENAEHPLSDFVARPSFLGVAFPVGRATLQAHYFDGASVSGHYDFESFRRERGSLESSLRGLGLSAGLGLGTAAGRPRVSLGARATVLRGRVSSESNEDWDVPERGGTTPFGFHLRQDAARYEVAGALGVTVALGRRFSLGAVYRQGFGEDLPYTSVSSFPALGLEYPQDGVSEWSTPHMLTIGAAFRTSRLLLTADLVASATPLFAYTLACFTYPRPAPQNICQPGPAGSGVFTAEGSTLRTGAEWTFERGPRSIHLRAGARWGDYSAFNVGLGVGFSRRWRVDTAYLDSDIARQGVLAASVEPRR